MKQPKSPDLPPKKSIDANSVLLPNISNFTQHEIEGYFAHHYPNCLVVCKPGSTGKGKPYAFITFKDANVVASLTKQKVLMIGKKQLAVRPAFENKAGEEAKAYVIKYDEEGSQNDAITVEVRRKDGKAMNSSISIDESLEFEVVLTNDSATGNVFLDGTFDSYGCSRLFRVDLKGIAYWQKNARNEEKCCILPKKRHTFSVVFSQPNLSRATYGKFTIYLGLTLCRTGGGTIRKRVAVVACVGDDAAMHLLRPTSAYVEPTQDDLNIVRTIIHAYPPERKSKSHLHTDVETYWVEELEAYDLPERVQLCIDTSDKYSNLNPWDLVDTYRQKMHDLLWMEEATQKKLLRRFDKHNVAITPVLEFQNRGMTEYCHDKSISKIEVSNLAEKRPSVLPGDIIYAWLPHTADYEYEGYVIMVQEDAVLVEFCENFHARFPTGTLFHIRFGFKRQYYRYLHRSVDKVSIDLVFPQKDQSKCEFVPLMDVRSTQQLHHKNFFNTEQLSAITKIVNKSTVPNNIPFVIRGPFGTGKSKVLIEAVYQLVHYRKSSRLLICTPSNTAADAVTEQLAEFLTPDHLFRLYAFHHKKQSVPLAILPYCYYLEDKEVFYVPAKEALMKYTVVVCTAVSAALLYGVGLRGHFSHIIMDEAAQVMEAEALIAMSLADTKACVILSGDEKQIGSVLQSGSVKHHGLANSIIERLIRSPYFTQLGDNAMLTFTKNYRTHSDILRFVSERFYTGQLEAMSKPTLVNWPRMPNRKFPIFFMAVQGEDARESDSPSYFNRYEVVAVVNMVQNLIDNKIATRDEIGIISPFYKQNGKIAMLCRERKLGYIKIGSVAEFQGKEKKILFVSTVRSNPHNLAYDKMYGLGLLKNRRHLNTALTRVTSLLVIVGDPYILQQDEDWAALIKYCKEHGNFAGGENTRDDATGNVSNVTPYAVRDHGRPVSTTVAVSTITSDSKKRREEIPSQVIESSSPPTSILCPTVSKIPSSQSPSLKVPRQFSSDQPIQPSTLPLDTGSSVLNTAREVGASAVPEHGPLQSFLTTPHPHTPQVLPQQSLLTPKCGTAPTPFSEHAEFMPVPQKRHKQQHNLSHGVYPLHSGRDFNHPDTGAGSQPRMRSQTSLLSLDSMSVLTSPRSFPVSPFNQSICDYCVSCQQLGHTSQDCLVQDIFCLVPGLFVVWKNPEAQGLVKRVVISPIVKLEMAVYQRDGGLQVTVCTMGYDVAELNSPKDFFLYLSSKPDHGNLPRKISVTIKVEFDEFPQVEVVESSPHIVSLFFCAQQHL